MKNFEVQYRGKYDLQGNNLENEFAKILTRYANEGRTEQ